MCACTQAPGQHDLCACYIGLILVHRHTRSHTCPAAHARSVTIGGPVQILSSSSATPCVHDVATTPGYLAMRDKRTAAYKANVYGLSAARHVCPLAKHLAPVSHPRPLTTAHITYEPCSSPAWCVIIAHTRHNICLRSLHHCSHIAPRSPALYGWDKAGPLRDMLFQ
jgi:hypothetical protein